MASSTQKMLFTSDLTEKLVVILREHMAEINNVICRMGMDVPTQEQWIQSIIQNHIDLYKDIMEDALKTEDILKKKIEDLLTKASQLCKLLRIKLKSYGAQEKPFYEEYELLKEDVKELEKSVEERQSQVNALKNRQTTLYKHLGRDPKPIRETPLPTPSELDALKDELNALEQEIFNREEEYMSIKCAIVDLCKELEIKPRLSLEKIVLSEDMPFEVTDENMKWVKEFHSSLKNSYAEMKQDIADVREKVAALWQILSEDIKMCNDFTQKNDGCTMSILKAWKEECKRCEVLKKANIQKFITNLRNEIYSLWEKCHFTSAEREEFVYYHSDVYTEDILTFHDLEIRKLKKYYDDNSVLFDLLEKWRESWNKLLDLEEKACDPGRFKNRGGTLLQEEKERNTLQKRLPVYEERLIELADNFKERMGREFLSWGETIPTQISKAHDTYKTEKENKLSARKQQRATPGQSGLGLSTVRTGSKLRLDTICTPSTKRPPLTPLFSNTKKKSKVTPANLKVPIIQVNGNTIRRRSRSSIDRSKRIRKIRHAVAQQAHNNSQLNTTFTDYDKFTEELQGHQRSTMFHLLPNPDNQ